MWVKNLADVSADKKEEKWKIGEKKEKMKKKEKEKKRWKNVKIIEKYTKDHSGIHMDSAFRRNHEFLHFQQN